MEILLAEEAPLQALNAYMLHCLKILAYYWAVLLRFLNQHCTCWYNPKWNFDFLNPPAGVLELVAARLDVVAQVVVVSRG